MVQSLHAFSPAKVNLSLRVLGCREDGYHQVETIYQMVEFGDMLHIVRQDGGLTIRSTDPGLPCGPQNLVWKAVAALEEVAGVRLGAEVLIEKRIPRAAGLGGGSSNAATALEVLNELYRLGCSKERLMQIAGSIGADVPFFLMGPTALGRGRGDELTPMSVRGAVPLLLVTPPLTISTQWTYQQWKFPLTASKADITIMASFLQEGKWSKITPHLHNDLEAIGVKVYPVIGQVRERLLELGAWAALMSGSGPTVFGLFSDPQAAREAAGALRSAPWQVIVTRTAEERPTLLSSAFNGSSCGWCC